LDSRPPAGSAANVALDPRRNHAYLGRVLIGVNQLGALLSVVIIDVVLAGDNAIVVGLAASGLPAGQRRRVIVIGVISATLLRILFAYFAAELLEIIGLTRAGGVLLLWVAWKMYRELRLTRTRAAVEAGQERLPLRQGGARRALTRIVLADVSMSLDNVLAVAGTAREHLWVLAFGLALSVALMGIASNYIARLLGRHFWISWIGLGIVTFVALRLIWDGSTEVIQQTAVFFMTGPAA
jgi:YjbE family integral membrane protein